MDDEEDDPETLQEIEKRKEEIMEEFLEIAFQKKHEALEEVKNECKKAKTKKEEEKKRLVEVQQQMDLKRKDGMNKINKRLNEIIADESLPLAERLNRLQDSEQIRAYMSAHFEQGAASENEPAKVS